jgi:hypothetical protein
MDIPINFMGEDFIAVVDYDVTFWGAPESGPTYSSGGEPAEPPEWEINSIVLRWDREARDGGLGPEFEATGELFDHLSNLDKINDAICEAIMSDGPPDFDDNYY